MNVDQYLKRIGVKDSGTGDLELLSRLQEQHLLHIPFENLDVMRKVPIGLDPAGYYEKIIGNHRGGFCYELNGLFHWLLTEIGYQTRLISATVMRPDGTWAMERSHAAQIVELDGPYLVDVGFGDSARVPLPLTGEEKEDVSGTYRALETEEGLYELQRKEEASWRTLLRFDLSAKALPDFEAACRFNQTSPDSNFTQKEIVTIATPDGRLTLSGNSLTISRNGEKDTVSITDEERAAILERDFGIRL
ncbi:arylamine N-acetyltransferase [Bhargavaea ullalensis]|uniref:N-hydroxyarylamine O-acetyltransferase n=1 Tax=Bhargavaea ullalensis TaxID=1265685 RepID=A0ABV2GBB7_9BACL